MYRISISLLIILIFGFLSSCTGSINQESLTIYKIAVFPFLPVSKDTECQYVGKALSYEVIAKMSYLKQVVVRSYNSVKGYDVSGLDFKGFVDDMDIEYLLSGEFHFNEGRLILNLNLIHLPFQNTIWNEQVEVASSRIFSLPAIITGEVASKIGVDPDEEEEGKLNLDISSNPEAYELYLKAVAYDPRTAKEWLNSIELLERSVRLDTNYAPSWCFLGYAYMSYSGLVGGKTGYYSKAEQSLLNALEVNKEFLYAMYYLGSLYAKTGKSESSVNILTNGAGKYPNHPDFYSGLGYVNRYAGQLDESILAYQKSQYLDSSISNLVGSQMQILKSQIYKGDYMEAQHSFEKVCRDLHILGEKPDEKQLFYGGVINLYLKDTITAITLFDSARTVDPISVWTMFGQAYTASLKDNKEALLDIVKHLESRDIVDGERRYRMVHFNAMAGKNKDALDHMNSSIEGGFFNYPYLISDPLTRTLRNEKKFWDLAENAKRRYDAFN